MADLAEKDFINTFVDEHEDNLPDSFDPPTMKKGDNCSLCQNHLHHLISLGVPNKKKGGRVHHCHRCGEVVCSKCSN